MEHVTIVTLSTFIAACLKKAGEKFSEKTIETAFESRQELAEKFAGLFTSDIIQLGLSDSATRADIDRQLTARPDVVAHGAAKLQSEVDSFRELLATLREAGTGEIVINNFASQTNHDKSVNIVGDNTKVTL